MYILTDAEEESGTTTAKEIYLLNELKLMIFETAEEENKSRQSIDADEWR